MIRTIQAEDITKAVRDMCIRANSYLPEDVVQALDDAIEAEDFEIAQGTLDVLRDNLKIARDKQVPICQDTGMACLYVEVGQDVHVEGSLTNALNEGVRQGYTEGYLRKSIVADPVLERVNTGDNTPASIHYDIVPGDRIHIVAAPKGFGSENMCQVKMMKPSDGIEGVKDFILQVVQDAGPNPCPPVVIGVGIGGAFDTVPLLAKQAMMKTIGEYNDDPRYAAVEKEMLGKVNALGIGPAGYGGRTTALGLHILTKPTHIAGMPVAVAICCHVARHQEVTL